MAQKRKVPERYNMSPTWQELGIPNNLVNYIKNTESNRILDTLLHFTVFHHNFKITYSYNCQQCTYIYKPEKSTDSIYGCPNCGAMRMRCIPDFKFNPKEYVSYTSKYSDVTEIIRRMYTNQALYFKVVERNLNCGWKDTPYCQFEHGELVKHGSPKLALIKAAILCPYNWDRNFDWNSSNKNKSYFNFLSPILFASIFGTISSESVR